MKRGLQILSLLSITIWSVTVWASYLDARGAQIPDRYELSDDFWTWEAQGLLNLIDGIIDIERADDLNKFAHTLITLQNTAYGVDIETPSLRFVEMRAGANGLYVPEDKTIYLNAKMDWNALPIERFAEVVLHENMHHILTHSGIDNNDFKYLSAVGFHHRELAMDNNHDLNPQENVAYRTQRAGRYVALNHRDLSTWEISTRMQEIRVIKSKIMN